MADWATISSLATAGGTLVLAIATFSAVRSSNRSARIAEVALMNQMRPVLGPSRLEDPIEKVPFQDIKWFRLTGGHGVAEYDDGVLFLVMGLRNVGTGLGVLRGWRARPRLITTVDDADHAPLETFHDQNRDIYIAPGDRGFWHGAIRDPDDPDLPGLLEALDAGAAITIELLYGDLEGGQRVVSRFGLLPVGESGWLVVVSKHWNLDRVDPR
jgi:hypothetical protein